MVIINDYRRSCRWNAVNADNIWNIPVPFVSSDKSISDNYLYEKYELTKEEIAFIENLGVSKHPKL